MDYVYYRREDYCGLLRRLASYAIDFSALGALGLTFVIAGSVFTLPAIGWIYLLLAYLYLTVMKRSVGTLGYLATGIRIVDLKGQRPGLVALTFRLVWCTFWMSPLLAFVELLFLSGDEDRQTLHDKMMQTYVIKRKALPAGNGARQPVILNILCLSLFVLEVARPRRP
jgi:uncharacterized RDD family membrane protein YckC